VLPSQNRDYVSVKTTLKAQFQWLVIGDGKRNYPSADAHI